MKLMVVMGYWSGDAGQAFEAVRLLTDLLPAKSEIASLLFVHRFDTKAPDKTFLNYCGLKFQSVHTRRGSVIGRGFPGGCNAIAFSAIRLMRSEPAFRGNEAWLLLESDCVATRRNWDVELWGEWEKAKAQGKLICGMVIPGAPKGYHAHINANCIMSRMIGQQVPAIGRGSMTVGWDWASGRYTVPVAYDSPLFFLDYRKPTITRDELFTHRKEGLVPLIYHGVKDLSAIQVVRQEYGI